MRLRTTILPALLVAATAITASVVASPSQAAPNHQSSTAVAALPAERTALAGHSFRPKVYLAYHGSEGLLGNRDHLWPFVRANLDGFWGNPFVPTPDTSASLARAIELTRKVEGRELIVEHPIVDGGCIAFRDDWYQLEVEKRAPDIRYERVAAAIYAGQNPRCWGSAGGMDAAMRTYQAQGYETVYTLFQPQNLSNTVNSPSFPTMNPGSAGDRAYRSSGGLVLECPLDACVDPTFGQPFFQGIQDARARGVPFVWFTGPPTAYGRGTSGWLTAVQRTYDAISAFGLWRPGDAVVIINYFGAYPALPERNANGTPADTTTGVLAWLLEQRPIDAICSTSC